jgi:5-methylcytosine-specific restriction endonuclease McrBC GTP-binding regulatory subunit McrB
MNNTEIRQEINQYLDRLSSNRLQLFAEFLAYLADKESEEATQKLLDIPKFIESFERGKKDIAEGRLANWKTIRSDV